MSRAVERDPEVEARLGKELLLRQELVDAVRTDRAMSDRMAGYVTMLVGGGLGIAFMLVAWWVAGDAGSLLNFPIGFALAWAFVADRTATSARKRVAAVVEILDRSGLLAGFQAGPADDGDLAAGSVASQIGSK